MWLKPYKVMICFNRQLKQTAINTTSSKFDAFFIAVHFSERVDTIAPEWGF